MIGISKRLKGVSGLVRPSGTLADVGTDHGYVPIYLIQKKRIRRAIAMDVNRGPLDKALDNIRDHQMGNKIETRLSDGFQALKKGEADTAVIAGIGGKLMIRILADGKEVVNGLASMVLQPQSGIREVRRYLTDQGIFIEDEDMVEELGKFYPMMRVVPGKSEYYSICEYTYGKRLLEKKNPVLERFLKKEERLKENLCKELGRHEGEKVRVRKKELEVELRLIREGLERYK